MINKKYKILYNDFIEHYKRVHINPWHEINKEQLNELYNKLINVMDVVDIYSFKYFIDYIIKRLCGETDAHTKFELLSLLPINFRIFDNDILVNYQSKYCYPDSEVLLNKYNVTDQEILDIIERRVSALMLTKIQMREIPNEQILFSVSYICQLHKEIFENIEEHTIGSRTSTDN